MVSVTAAAKGYGADCSLSLWMDARRTATITSMAFLRQDPSSLAHSAVDLAEISSGLSKDIKE